MDEEIFAAIAGGDESEALGVVEPLDGALEPLAALIRHGFLSFSLESPTSMRIEESESVGGVGGLGELILDSP